MTEPAGLRDEERAELLLRAYLEAQQEAKGAMPISGGNVLTRFRGVFECFGAIQLGLLMACVTILLNFVIGVMVFHVDISRYAGFLFPL